MSRTEFEVGDIGYISGTATTAGDKELVAAPGTGSQLVVTSFIIQNESSTANTMIMKAGSNEHFRVLGQNQGDGYSRDFAAWEFWELGENAALNLNLSTASQCGYSIAYYTEII